MESDGNFMTNCIFFDFLRKEGVIKYSGPCTLETPAAPSVGHGLTSMRVG